jgi:hypothetical protein
LRKPKNKFFFDFLIFFAGGKIIFVGWGLGGGFDFKILTALKGWVGHAPQGRGALHIII